MLRISEIKRKVAIISLEHLANETAFLELFEFFLIEQNPPKGFLKTA